MNVLFIVGDSRSGSTLLQYLLALQDGVVALGELRRLEQMIDTGEPCACGRQIENCPFWKQAREVFDRYAGDELVVLGYESNKDWVLAPGEDE